MILEAGSSSSSSSSKSGWTYDVFLSFRGEDTRKSFTNHLYSALVQAGIHTFRDDELPRGQEISSQLRKAIKESRISIVVFSKGYASSRWCLDELEEILECKHRNEGQIAIPIFYDIDPSDVRNRKRSFAEAFERHEERFKEEMEKVNKWRQALLEAGNLSGWDSENLANGHESKFIQMIVGDVSKKLDNKLLHIAKYPIGIDFHVDRIIDLLSIGTNDDGVVGIYGMPGVGKTTIAKAVFNRLCYEYEGCCFLFNVKEISNKDNGMVQLQEQLLCEILKPNIFKICNEYRGINLIKERLCHRRVLIVVDDVDQLKQLEALVGEKSWFSARSTIIITTRDEYLLTQFEVHKRFKVEELGKDESLQLFSWHAFRNTHPSEDWFELSNRVVKYCGGLPLALEVLGCSLFKRSQTEWESAIERLQIIPPCNIQKKLEISFYTLDDDIKHVFLDISCFFIGRGKDYVAKILHARCGYEPEINIVTLLERSLLTIDRFSKLRMHDLLRDMGRELVRQMSPQHPGKRSRIWLHKNACDVLEKRMGTDIVEGLALDVRAAEAISFSTESFTTMRHLQLLQINGIQLVGSYEHLSKDLMWLCWLECPLKSLPSNFQLDNIAVLDLQHSNLTELWKETKSLNKLKILNLSHSEYLAKTPDFLGSPNLERLMLEDCPSLTKVHQSIGHLRKLVFLNLKGCCRLRDLPQSICDLKSLETLNLNMCSQLQMLPDCFGDMESLTELLADETAIAVLPSSIGNLKSLTKLSLSGCNYSDDKPSASWLSKLSSWVSPRSSSSKALLPASFFGLTSLRELKLNYCGLSEDTVSVDLGCIPSLVNLYLEGNNFFNLPSGIGQLPKLEILGVSNCNNLRSISEIPSSLDELHAYGCESMERVSLPSKTEALLLVGGCKNLIEIQGIEAGVNGWAFLVTNCNNLSDDFKKMLVRACGEDYDIMVFGVELPEWFSHRGEGSSVSFQVPKAVSDGTIHALVLWIIVCPKTECRYFATGGRLIIKTNGNKLFKRQIVGTFTQNYGKHSHISHMTLTGIPFKVEGGDEMEFYVDFFGWKEIEVERCGIHLIMQKPDATANDVEARWKSFLTRELLQQSSQICSASSKRHVWLEEKEKIIVTPQGWFRVTFSKNQ